MRICFAKVGVAWVFLMTFLLPLMPVHAEEDFRAKALIPLKECPPDMKACMTFEIAISQLLKKNSPYYIHYDMNVIGSEGMAYVRLQGRLNNGPKTEHIVAFDYPGDGMGCYESIVPTIGVDSPPKHGGTILTKQGPLLIDDPNIYVTSFAIKLINKKSGEISEHLSRAWAPWHLLETVTVSPDGKIYRQIENACLDIETETGFKSVSLEYCKDKNLTKLTSEDKTFLFKSGIVQEGKEDKRNYFFDGYDQNPFEFQSTIGTSFIFWAQSDTCEG